MAAAGGPGISLSAFEVGDEVFDCKWPAAEVKNEARLGEDE